MRITSNPVKNTKAASESATWEKTIRVMIVEDHGVVLWGLKRLIEGEAPSMRVVGVARNGREAQETARTTRPDVIVLDLSLGKDNALTFLPQLRDVSKARVLVLTATRDAEVHRLAIQRGASGVVMKDEPADVVLKAVKKVYEGEIWLDRSAAYVALTDRLHSPGVDPLQAERIASLTPREREVITVLASEENFTNKQLALRLRISEHTLRNHLASIYDKLGVSNRLELLKFAIANGLD